MLILRRDGGAVPAPKPLLLQEEAKFTVEMQWNVEIGSILAQDIHWAKGGRTSQKLH